MDMSELPPFWLAYLSDPSDSGRIHSNVRQRWLSGASPRLTLRPHTPELGLRRGRIGSRASALAPPTPAFSPRPPLRVNTSCVSPGEPLVVEAMRTFAELTDQARWV